MTDPLDIPPFLDRRKKNMDTHIIVQPVEHSKIGASGAHRWFNCPGSINLIKKLPPAEHGSSEYAKEGTAAHEICARCLTNGQEAWEYAGWTVEVEGSTFTVDDDMVVGVQLYVDTVRGQQSDQSQTFVEASFRLADVHPDLFGSSDAVVHCALRNDGHLFVDDFKYGAGIKVDPEWNEQLLIYGVGAAAFLLEKDDTLAINRVELVVVQPRIDCKEGPVRQWSLSYDELGEWVDCTLRPNAKATDDPDAPLKMGDWCGFCPATLHCPLHQKNAETVVAEAEDGARLTDMSDEDLDAAAWRLKRLRAYEKAVGDEMYARMVRKGRPMKQFKVVKKRADRTWKDDYVAMAKISAAELELPDDWSEEQQEEYKKFLKVFGGGRDPYAAPKLQTPAVVAKMPGGGELVSAHAYIPDNGLTVVENSHKSPAVPVRSAADVFEGVDTSE